MQEPIVTYRQAHMLKELGFNEKTTHFYDIIDETLYLCHNQKLDEGNFNEKEMYVSAPNISLALAWIRIQKKVPCGAFPFQSNANLSVVSYNWRYYAKDEEDFSICHESNELSPFPTYALAESDLLAKVLEYLVNKSH